MLKYPLQSEMQVAEPRTSYCQKKEAQHFMGHFTFYWRQCLAHLSGFPDSSVGKESTCNAADAGSIPALGRYAGEGIGYPLQYSWASLVAQLVNNLPAMWKTWIGSLGWEDPWRRERLPILVFWPGEFHELHSPWGHKELDMTEWLLPHWYTLIGYLQRWELVT